MELILIQKLKEKLPESSWPVVFRSLRQDKTVWSRLLNEEFSNHLLDLLGGNPKLWTPINLSMLDAGYNIFSNNLINKLKISEELKNSANLVFEEFSTEKEIDLNIPLEKAGLLAFSIYERWNKRGNWDFLIVETNFAPIVVLKPIFASLLGLLESPESFLAFLLSEKSNSDYIGLGVYALLCSQFTQEEIIDLITEQIVKKDILTQLKILHVIEKMNAVLSKEIALKITNLINAGEDQDTKFSSNVEELFALAEIHQISGQISKAIPLLDAAWEQNRKDQINRTAKYANLAVLNNDASTAYKAIHRAAKLNPKFENAEADFAVAQFQSGKIDPKHFNDNSVMDEALQNDSPEYLIVQAKLALETGDSAHAKTLAIKSFDRTIELNKQFEEVIEKTHLKINYLNGLIKILYELKMYEETLLISKILIKNYPNDYEILSIISQSLLALGKYDQAADFSQLTISLDPKSKNDRRILGKSLMALESWNKALTEYKNLVEKTSQYEEEDHYSMALSALNSDEDQIAIETSEKIIENNPSNGKALALLGEACIKQGNVELAMDHLDQAISLSPEIAEPWLSLSNYQMDIGDLKKATEILITANQAIPENVKLRYELGKCYSINKQTTKALTEIQHAASLLSIESPILSQEVNISLGSTLMDLGYFDEAKKRLSSAHLSYPDNLKLSHIYAKSLIGVEEIPEAIKILAEAIQSPKADLNIFRDYGEAHLKLGKNSKEAILAFEKVLTIEPDNPKSIALMAEAIALDGDLKKSLETFNLALAKGLSDDPKWNLRIKIGMAKAALASNKPDVAVVALEDLIKNNPDDLRVLQILTDAYLASNLQENALQTLEIVRELENNYPATLIWIADKALVLDQGEIATQALISAVKLAPDNSNILVKLGYMHLQNQEISLAKDIFESVLKTTNPATKDLRLITKALIGLDDIVESVPYYERAIAKADEDQKELITELLAVCLQLNNFEKALALIEQQISLYPEESQLLHTKADILLDLERPKDALSTIQKAINNDPTDSELQMKASKLFRINHDLPAALNHSEIALEQDPENNEIQMHAAEINLISLNFSQLDKLLIETLGSPENDLLRMVKIERLILAGEYVKAIELYEKIVQTKRDDPKYLAIQAQLNFHNGDPIEAKSALRLAVKNIEKIENINLSNEELNNFRFSIIQAALNLSEWETALELTNKAIESLPNEPLPYWLQLKAIVMRAEFQHLCKTAKVIKHAPGSESINDQAKNVFEEIVDATLQHSFTDIGKNEVMRWKTRGQLAFDYSEPNLEFLFDSAEDFAAQISALRRQGKTEEAIHIAQTQKNIPEVLLQLALCLEDQGLMEAQGAAYKATEIQGSFPINHAILAYLAEQNEEYSLASESIRRALNIWGDESEWHILAGQLQSALGFRSSTIAHFEKANQLWPNNPEYILELGKAHLSDQRSENAIKIFEKAIQLNQDNPELWSNLAKAYQESKNYDQASFCVDKLTELIPDQVEPYLVGAKINLAAEKLEKAEKMISKALSIEPELISAHQLQAQALSLGNEPEKAIAVLDEVIATTSDPLALLIDRAKLIPLIHGEEIGLSTLKSIAKEYPKEPTILMALTETLIQAGKYEEAIESAQYALKVNFGKLEQKEIAHLQFQLGILLKQNGQYDLAIHYLNESIQLSPGFLNTYLEIAEVFRKRRQHDQALDYLKQAISIAPKDARPFTIAGNLLKEAKDYQGAKEMLDRAASLAPKDLEIQRKLGAVIALTLVHPTQNREE